MSHFQKFDTAMFEYCSGQAERAYKLIEDGETDNGLNYLGHLADVLQMLMESRTDQNTTNINEFARSVSRLEDLEKDAVYTHMQQSGFGQYIPE